jgi:hypothetical protein
MGISVKTTGYSLDTFQDTFQDTGYWILNTMDMGTHPPL